MAAILDYDKFVRSEKLSIPRLMFKMDLKIISFKLELDRIVISHVLCLAAILDF
jgi:hypothetical protein